jgi:hypothetical protein
MGRPRRKGALGLLALEVALATTIALVVSVGAVAIAGDDGDGDPDQVRRVAASGHPSPLVFEARSLDGSGNNEAHPQWGQVGTEYLRTAPDAYADGVSEMEDGPDPRYVSNRVFNDDGQNVFSGRGLTQWVWTWGQFLDHTFGLRQQGQQGEEEAPLAFDPDDPLEDFENDLGGIAFARTPAAPGTGEDEPREQVNTVSSYIDAWAVYGGTDERLEWLRDGSVDGDLSDNAATLMLPGGYLPEVTARGDADEAPTMELPGRLAATPDAAVVAGDVRANENLALTAVHTLFAREHNRIVDALPDDMDDQQRFEIARRVVGAEQQYVTYTEFLPALGVRLPAYDGYDARVDASLSNEFAAVAYRMHSMIHGEFEIEVEAGTYTDAQLDAFEDQGIEVGEDDGELALEVPLHLAFGNPSLVEEIGLGPVVAGLAGEGQYANDEQIDNQLRSVLFQVPSPDTEDPGECFEAEADPDCFSGVLDLGAIDVQRGRDHGISSYNDLREAFGLAPAESFTDVTGEVTESFPSTPAVDGDDPIDDPDIVDAIALFDADGNRVEPGTEAAAEAVVTAVRRTPLAARLEAMYGSVDRLDAFVGMVSEPHVPGSELGGLQLAIWRDQFERVRDGDRFFYGNDPALGEIEDRYGVGFRHTLGEIIAANTDAGEIQDDVFRLDQDDEAADEADEAERCPRRHRYGSGFAPSTKGDDDGCTPGGHGSRREGPSRLRERRPGDTGDADPPAGQRVPPALGRRRDAEFPR